MSARGIRVHITDHSLRRFFERVCGLEVIGDHDGEAVAAFAAARAIDLDKVRLSLATALERGVALGAPAIRMGRHRYVMKNQTLVTIEPAPGRYRKRRSPRVASGGD